MRHPNGMCGSSKRARAALRVILAGTVALVMQQQAAAGQEQNRAEKQRNAALQYWPSLKAIAMWKECTPSGRAMQESDEPGPVRDRALRENREEIERLVRISRTERCEWQPEWSDPTEAPRSHVSSMYAAARLVAFDAGRAFAEHRSAEGTDRVIAVLRMAAHMRGEDATMVWLHPIRLVQLACAQAQAAVDSGAINKEDRRRVHDALDRFRGPDAFGVRQAVREDAGILIQWIEREYKPDQPTDAVRERLYRLVDPDDADRGTETALMFRNNDGVEEAVRRYTDAVDDYAAIWETPDAQRELRALEKRIEAREYGRLARSFPLSAVPFREHAGALSEVEATRARLQE